MLDKQQMIAPENALPGRDVPMAIDDTHFVNHSSLTAAPSGNQQQVLLGMGCFWGAERVFWQLDGVVSTSVGYAGGYTPNPTYEEVCTGHTGHTEVVRVVFDSDKISLQELLKTFWENTTRRKVCAKETTVALSTVQQSTFLTISKCR